MWLASACARKEGGMYCMKSTMGRLWDKNFSCMSYTRVTSERPWSIAYFAKRCVACLVSVLTNHCYRLHPPPL
jgi:hypothetical protein